MESRSRHSTTATSANINRQDDTKLDFEGAELQFHDRLKQSHNELDSLLALGDYMLRNVKEQHSELRGVRKKVVDVGQMFGLSNTTLRMIERRLSEDWLLFIILAVFFLIFMYCFYRYWRG